MIKIQDAYSIKAKHEDEASLKRLEKQFKDEEKQMNKAVRSR